MISIEDLKDSLRHQLSALIALYEDDAVALDLLRHGGDGTREVGNAPAAETNDAMPRTDDAAGASDSDRAYEIELCLVSFEAAILAAERAERLRETASRAALAAMERSAAARRVATAQRQDLQRLILVAGRSFGGPDGDLDARRLAEMRAALRIGEAACRHADREAQEARRRAEIAISSASAALLAAIQADPARGNPDLDPTVARAARALAERAADEAARTLEEAAPRGDAVVVPFDRGAAARPDVAKPGE